MAGVWLLGLVPGTLYMIFNPDGIPHPDRFSYGKWLQALKYTPLPHLASFVFGVLLAELDEIVPRQGTLRLSVGVVGFAGTFASPGAGAEPAIRHSARRLIDATLWVHHSRTWRE